VSIAANSLGEIPIGAQVVGCGSKSPAKRPPSNRQLVAKADAVVQPEPR